jgi:hypothetical protein
MQHSIIVASTHALIMVRMCQAKHKAKEKSKNAAIATVVMLECAVNANGMNSVVCARNKRNICQPADKHS